AGTWVAERCRKRPVPTRPGRRTERRSRCARRLGGVRGESFPPAAGGAAFEDTMSQNVNIEHEMRKSYLEYSLSVIIGRAIPDVRDGLKPVHRRIRFEQQELANSYNRPPKKCARIVGDVIGKYHPHGDSAVYDALVRLAQDFSMRDPLEDGQDHFGS